MIRFENVCKSYRLKSGRKVVLDHVSIHIPPRMRLGILGLNGAGKSTLMRMFAGGELPDSGRIRRNGRISFPVGFTGTFFPLQSGRENVKFLARVYGMNEREVASWVEHFSELGHYFDMPMGTYSSGMHTRIAFATSFAFDFDFYLVDEAFETGDKNFRTKCAKVFEHRLRDAGLVLISHNMRTIRDNCDTGALLHNGKIHMHASIEETIMHYEQLLRNS
jgi:capsular polysaccharide transport system ATP-binding protein